jgi:hypothetical protein
MKLIDEPDLDEVAGGYTEKELIEFLHRFQRELDRMGYPPADYWI